MLFIETIKERLIVPLLDTLLVHQLLLSMSPNTQQVDRKLRMIRMIRNFTSQEKNERCRKRKREKGEEMIQLQNASLHAGRSGRVNTERNDAEMCGLLQIVFKGV